MHFKDIAKEVKIVQIQLPNIAKPDKVKGKALHSIWQKASNDIFVKQS